MCEVMGRRTVFGCALGGLLLGPGLGELGEALEGKVELLCEFARGGGGGAHDVGQQLQRGGRRACAARCEVAVDGLHQVSHHPPANEDSRLCPSTGVSERTRREGGSEEVRCQIWRGEMIRYLAHGGLSVAARENEGQALHDSHFHVPVAHALTVRIEGREGAW